MSSPGCFPKGPFCRYWLLSRRAHPEFMNMEAVILLHSVMPRRTVLQSSSICMPQRNGQSICSETARVTCLDHASTVQHGNSNVANSHCSHDQLHAGSNSIVGRTLLACGTVLSRMADMLPW